MAPPVRRLRAPDEPALSALLSHRPVEDLFLRSVLRRRPVGEVSWYGLGAPLSAAVLVIPHRLAVPSAQDPADAAALGAHLRQHHAPTLLVGPRAACDALWATWAPGAPVLRRHDQRLFVLREVPPGEPPPGLRRARTEERDLVADAAARMELEDLGRDPSGDPTHREAAAERIRDGRTFVVVRDGELRYAINVGVVHPDGCQLGGTWVPPEHRGRGLATAATAAVCRHLRAPLVTLHANEANAAAVRVYEKIGFQRDAAFRLVVPA